jgi:PST family polysaccharide transporter
LGFSSKVFLGSLAGFFYSQSDALLIGLFYGPTAVGIYRFGDRLIRMLLKLLSRAVHVVALPHFSTFQHDKGQLRLALISCWRKSAALTIPAMFLLAGISDDFVRFIGPQWTIAADVVKLLSLVGIAMAISLFTGPILQAAGRPGLQACMAWVIAIGITVAFIIVGLLTKHLTGYWQVTLMAASRAVVFLLLFLPVNLALARYITGVSYRDLFTATWRTMVTGINIFVIVKGFALSIAQWHLPAFCLVLAEVFVGFAVWSVSLYALNRQIRERIRLISRGESGKFSFSLRTVRHFAGL